MRRSKSNPSRYAKNYRRISQRCMTKEEKGSTEKTGEDGEMERLRVLLQKSEAHLRKVTMPMPIPTTTGKYEVGDNDKTNKGLKYSGNSTVKGDNTMMTEPLPQEGEEVITMLDEDPVSYTTDDIPDIVPSRPTKTTSGLPSKGSKSGTKTTTLLNMVSPTEIRDARRLHKSNTRKFEQLRKRKEQREKRTALYDTLSEHSLTVEQLALMGRTSELGRWGRGKEKNKREMLRDLLRRERMGIGLDDGGKDLLYSGIAGDENKDGDADNYENEDSHMFHSFSPEINIEGKTKTKGKKKEKVNKLKKENLKESKKEKEKVESGNDNKKKRKNDDVFTESDTENKIESETENEMEIEMENEIENGNKNENEDESENENENEKESERRKRKNYKKRERMRDRKKNEKRMRCEINNDDNEKLDENCIDTINGNGSIEESGGIDDDNVDVPDADDFARRMMEGLVDLHSESTVRNEKLERHKVEEERLRMKKVEEVERERLRNVKKYIPTNPVVIQTAGPLLPDRDNDGEEEDINDNSEEGDVSSNDKDKTKKKIRQKKNEQKEVNRDKRGGGRATNWKVRTVQRPPDVETTRYSLPVSSMEYDIVDSVRVNGVTVLCSETGGGKSTQVPQFLYESGISVGNACDEASDQALLIGITQPRRVATVSTAKRVRYEMGGGNIDLKNSLVAYQTRHETSGIGSKTRIKFMTDGILLNEIQADLLLRKYAVIVLDEAHERNLNTDVLIGLLGKTLILREEAAKNIRQGTKGASGGSLSLPPLRIIIMSATLRIEDFLGKSEGGGGGPFESLSTTNKTKINVIKVPGRTHPVTVHYDRVTELDDYEEAAFRKARKIHRRLPTGGILIFLTGRAEVMKMVRKLRSSLVPRKRKSGGRESRCEIGLGNDIDIGMDGDEEYDEYDEYDDDDEVLVDSTEGDIDETRESGSDEEKGKVANKQEHDVEAQDGENINDSESNIPQKVKVLPLFSLLSVGEQAKVFEPVPEGTRLIVVATNIAETSITIPGVTYVIDSGRQKCRNYHASTGVASYDVMWISKASADQRAGRAGRTGPGHAYRLYSSSVYDRQFDAHPLPEILTRPLEDVVLTAKAMGIRNVSAFPFPTPPDIYQVRAAVNLLADIECIELPDLEVGQISNDGVEGDGVITNLGAKLAKLPLSVRCGKILLNAAESGVLDYGIAIVAVLSESSPFVLGSEDLGIGEEEEVGEEEKEGIPQRRRRGSKKWIHQGGDVLAGMLAAGAYAYAGVGVPGRQQQKKNRILLNNFCQENGLHPVVMERIHRARIHLAKLAARKLDNTTSAAGKTGGILKSMQPPNKIQEDLLRQAIISGFLDNVARRSPPGTLIGGDNTIPKAAFFSCRTGMTEPLFIDKNSVLFSRDYRQLPEWVCFDTIVRKSTRDGSTISTMRNVTPVEPSWLGQIAKCSRLITRGKPLDTPLPLYSSNKDAIMCSVVTKFGSWLIPPVRVEMQKVLQESKTPQASGITIDDPYRWFARYLLEGKVLKELVIPSSMLNDNPSIITRKKPVSKVALLVSALSSHGVDSASALVQQWARYDDKFLFKIMKSWIKKEYASDVKNIWVNAVKTNILRYNEKII